MTSEIEEILDEVDIKYRNFKKFDIVTENPSDHHYYSRLSPSLKYENETCIKHEWDLLEKNLPDSIRVRVYHNQSFIDLMKAVIVGPRATPYCYGLFFFDIWFPPDYPISPPKFYYHCHGVHLNFDIQEKIENNWSSTESTILGVLTYIQTHVLNAKPYFNDLPQKVDRSWGESNKSVSYNNEVFELSCKKMLHTLKNPPKPFGDFVRGYFRGSSHCILMSCEEYMKAGCNIGKLVKLLYNTFEANGSYIKHLQRIWKDEDEEENKGDNLSEKVFIMGTRNLSRIVGFYG